jgi:hypothetical protein
MPQQLCGDSAAFARWQPLGRPDYLHNMARRDGQQLFSIGQPISVRNGAQAQCLIEIGHQFATHRSSRGRQDFQRGLGRQA